ncbi:MAG: TetR/AcrR family transcriptional regulator [Deltaproteobacteria bacterium]|nr:TetR/AcrR family transcriptional regulator [Deltaproteobacteria bacterium]
MIKSNIKNPDRVRMRQKQICRGAIKVFRKKGFHATSMREIAKSAQISLGNLYDYIEKKEDILFLAHRDILEQIYQAFDETAAAFDGSVDRLVNVIRAIVKRSFELRQEILFCYTETKSLEKKYMKEILRKESEFVGKIEVLIRDGIAAGELRCEEPGVLANVIWYNMTILALRGWNILPAYSVETFTDELIRFTLRGLCARENVKIDKEE